MMYHQAHKTPCDQAAARGGDGRRNRSAGILACAGERSPSLLSRPGAAGPCSRAAQGFTSASPSCLPLLVIYFCWVRTCWWVDQDVADLRLADDALEPSLVRLGLLGLLMVWLLPWFWLLSLPVLLVSLPHAQPGLRQPAQRRCRPESSGCSPSAICKELAPVSQAWISARGGGRS